MLILTAGAEPQASPVRKADAACARCHAKIMRTYLSSPMANASGLASERLIPGAYSHKASQVDYSVGRVGGLPMLTVRSAHNSGWQDAQPLSYFLGSGHLGLTYLYFVRDYLFESPVAWYAAPGKYDMKPGFAGLPSMPPAIPMQSACLRCHMSGVVETIPGTINRYQDLPFVSTGITCESCHGDSNAHVRAGGKAAIVNPGRLSAEERDSVCISCHLEGDVTVERAGRSALNYEPGHSISTYLAYYVRGGSNLTARGVSEVEQLSQSVCKRTSGDRMSCTSCHDPHFTPSREQRTAFYREKCLACHAETNFAAQHHPENHDCTSCHMPRSGAENIPHVAWTDHRILRVPESPEPAGAAVAAKPSTELRPIFSPGATQRDLAMAEYKLMLDGDREFGAPALKSLLAIKGSISNDDAALDALGSLSAGRGDFSEAGQDFRRVLALDPNDVTALSNLGVMLAKQGKTLEGVELLRRAFDRNEDLPGLAMNLARTECLAGDSASASKTLEEALVFSPGFEELEHLLDGMKDCRAYRGGQ